MGAQFVEEVFQVMGPVHQVLGFEKACPALEGVKGPKERGQDLVIVGISLQAQGVLLGLLE